MRILVACEESQAVTIAFRDKGHQAYSCDVVDCSGGRPEWHIKGDVLNVIDDGWDMLIGFPPCTYLSNAGANHLFAGKKLNKDRYKKGLDGKEFFLKLYKSNIEKICIENPTPMSIFELPNPSQIIQPYFFGHKYSKRTCLWLKGLPILMSTKIMGERESTMKSKWFQNGGKERQKNRSKTFTGIAKAMADQWG